MITYIQEKILRALAKYKYLTISQLVDLGVSDSINTIRLYINTLQNQKLIKKSIYRQTIQETHKNKSIRLEGLNFLDTEGVKILKDSFDMENIKYPQKHKLSFSNDYFHRIYMVSACISFDLWLEKTQKDGYFLIDFHNSETTIKINDTTTVKPDIIVNFNGNYAILEVWAGVEKEYITSKLSKVFKAIASKKVSDFLNYEKAPRILNIFKDSDTMERVKHTLKTTPFFENGVNKGLFCFTTTDQIKENFNLWQDINGKTIDIEAF
jgi:hypothetical protein